MKRELKSMFEGMQDALLDAESLSVYGGDKPSCPVGCTQSCVLMCSSSAAVAS